VYPTRDIGTDTGRSAYAMGLSTSP